MAEERRDDRPVRQEERSGSAGQDSATAVTGKKKKKRSKLNLLFLLFLLAFGVGTGLHFSGMWDARPLVWQIVPEIPYIGKSLARFFNIPEQYTLTVAARRAYELKEWQKRLDERERTLGTREAAVDAISDDVGARSERLARAESTVQQNANQKNGSGAPDAEKKLIDQVAKTYQDMSPRNAAQIVEQVSEPLAVEILQKLPIDVRASIMGKMDPKKAARLTELMTLAKQR